MSKSIIFLAKSFLANFYRHWAIFSGHTGSRYDRALQLYSHTVGSFIVGSCTTVELLLMILPRAFRRVMTGLL